MKANKIQKQAGVAILISDKTDFKSKLVRKDIEDHYILIKGTIKQEKIMITNIYALNIRVPNFIKQIVLDIKR
jgi:hypothetical protein